MKLLQIIKSIIAYIVNIILVIKYSSYIYTVYIMVLIFTLTFDFPAGKNLIFLKYNKNTLSKILHDFNFHLGINQFSKNHPNAKCFWTPQI